MKEITDDIYNAIANHILANKSAYGDAWHLSKEQIIEKLKTIKINAVENIEDLRSLKGNACVYFRCKQCGNIYFSLNSFRTSKINNLSKFLCVPCLKKAIFIERYGTDNPMKNVEIKNKTMLTWKNKTEDELRDIYYTKRHKKTDEEKQIINLKSKQTKLKRYGNENYNNVSKNKQTKLERYGDKKYNNLSKAENTKLERYGDAHFNNLEKRHVTCQQRYGKDNACESPEVVYKINESTMAKLGVKRPIQDARILQQMQTVMKNRYGAKTTMESPILRERVENTNLVKYGFKTPLSNNDVRNKAKETMYKNTGCDHPIVSKINYYGIRFDSKWELAIWIYAKDHNEYILREPVKYEYMYNDKIHAVYPDFYYNGKIIEIKGDHLYDKSSKFNSRNILKDKIKHRIEKENGVEFWFSEKCLPYVKYVEYIYGKEYMNLFYVDNPMNPTYLYPNGFIPIIRPYTNMYPYYTMPVFSRHGIMPYDNKNDKYVDIKSKGITPYDL